MLTCRRQAARELRGGRQKVGAFGLALRDAALLWRIQRRRASLARGHTLRLRQVETLPSHSPRAAAEKSVRSDPDERAAPILRHWRGRMRPMALCITTRAHSHLIVCMAERDARGVRGQGRARSDRRRRSRRAPAAILEFRLPSRLMSEGQAMSWLLPLRASHALVPVPRSPSSRANAVAFVRISRAKGYSSAEKRDTFSPQRPREGDVPPSSTGKRQTGGDLSTAKLDQLQRIDRRVPLLLRPLERKLLATARCWPCCCPSAPARRGRARSRRRSWSGKKLKSPSNAPARNASPVMAACASGRDDLAAALDQRRASASIWNLKLLDLFHLPSTPEQSNSRRVFIRASRSKNSAAARSPVDRRKPLRQEARLPGSQGAQRTPVSR